MYQSTQNYYRTGGCRIKCVLKCDGDCYVRALWGVPVFNLVQFLHKEWEEMIDSVTAFEPELIPCKSIYADRPFVLADNVEETIEFQSPSHFEEFVLSDVGLHKRTVYPFVLLMVLNKRDNGPAYPDPHAIAVAYVFHLPNNVMNKVQFIGQFSRSSSGLVGQLIKIYRCSGEENSCIICFQEQASVVQLSCRHCCACRRCYEKCTKCPICRNTYMDFFEIPNANNQH